MNRARTNAYTLIELMVVVTIIVIVLSLFVVSLNKAVERAASVNCQSNLRQLGMLIATYAMSHSGQLPEFTKYRWVGQVRYFEDGEYGWKDRDEYPELAGRTDVEPGSYFIIKPRDDRLFVCPVERTQQMNLQGVRSSYAGLTVNDYRNVDSIEFPNATMLLLEYEANEVNVIYADGSDEICYITDSIQHPEPGATTPIDLYRVALNHANGTCGNVLFVDRHIECVSGQEALVMAWDPDYSTTSTTTSTSTTSTSTTSTTSVSTSSTSVPTTIPGGDDDDDDDDEPPLTTTTIGPGGGTTTTSIRPGDDDDDTTTTTSVPTTTTTSTSTSISTTTSTTTTTIKTYIGPLF
jgi:prepilin-type N-terminal cleavage/methylation domain-containing protein